MRNDTDQLVVSLLVLIIFVMFLIGFFYLIITRALKKKKNVKNYAILHVFTGFNSLEIVSISMLTVRELFYVWCFTQPKASLVFLIILIFVGLIFNAVNRRFVNMFIDILNSCLLYAVLMAKCIFFDYLVDVAVVWHVVVFLVFLIVFGVIYSLYFYFKDVKSIAIDSNIRLGKKSKP